MKKKKIKRKNKKIILIILILIIILLIILILPKNKNIYYIKDNNIYYNNKKINNYYPSNKILISKDNKKVLYSDYKGLYLYDKKNKKIANQVLNYSFINNDVVYIDINNNLYIYKNKKILISKKINNILYKTNKYIVYMKNNKIYSYNISKNKNTYITKNTNVDISKDNNNLLLLDKNIKIYNLDNNKIIKKQQDINKYYCINDSCNEFYYQKLNTIYSTNNKKIKEDITSLEYYDSNILIYTKYINNKYNLYYKKGNNKSIKLDSSKLPITNIKLVGNKIYYVIGGNLKEVKTNGKSKKNITYEVTNIVDIYKGKILLLKNKKLYLNDKLIQEDVIPESIAIINDKILFLVPEKDINSLYSSSGNKAKLIAKNVKEYYEYKEDIYYIGDYNIGRQYGNLYKYKHKNLNIKKIQSIIKDSE